MRAISSRGETQISNLRQTKEDIYHKVSFRLWMKANETFYLVTVRSQCFINQLIVYDEIL